MGAACCVAAKDKTVSSGSHTRHSPNWSLRWDNRVREAEEEEDSVEISLRNPSFSGNVRMGSKSSDDNTTAAAFGSEKDSPLLDSSQKSTASESTAGIQRIPLCGPASPQTITDVKESETGPSSTPRLVLHQRSPAQRLVLQSSDYNNNNDNNQTPYHKSPGTPHSIISEEASLHIPPSSGNESTRSFDTVSIPGLFSDPTNLRIGERWSFDSEASGLSRDKISLKSSGSLSFDQHSCGICSKQLSERPPWGFGSNKLISSNGLSIVSVLTCGHVYHAECLEYMTPEINKYDPSCPVCVFGEKTMAKMSENALKARKKKSRNCVVDSDLSDVSSDFNNTSSGGLEEKGSKKPFLRRHFSFGSKPSTSSKPSSDRRGASSAKKGFFWARSTKY